MNFLLKIFDSGPARILTFMFGVVGLYIGLVSYLDSVPGRNLVYSVRHKSILSNFKDMGNIKVQIGSAELSASPSNMILFSLINSGNSEIEPLHIVDKIRFNFSSDLRFVGHSMINESDMSNIKLSQNGSSFSVDVIQKWFPSSGINLTFVSSDSVSEPIVSKSGQVRDFKNLSQPYQTISSRILSYIEVNKGFSLYFAALGGIFMIIAIALKSVEGRIRNQNIKVFSQNYTEFIFSSLGNLIYQIFFLALMIIILLPQFL